MNSTTTSSPPPVRVNGCREKHCFRRILSQFLHLYCNAKFAHLFHCLENVHQYSKALSVLMKSRIICQILLS